MVKSLIEKIYWVVCYLPWLYIIAFYSYVLRAIIRLNYVPSFDNPDPKVLGFYFHHALIYLLWEFSMWAVVAWGILRLVMYFMEIKVSKRETKVFTIAVIVFIYNIIIDPFMTWFVD